jgi:methionyl-tRNA formyltransferase
MRIALIGSSSLSVAVAAELLDQGHDLTVFPPAGDKLEDWGRQNRVAVGELNVGDVAGSEPEIMVCAHNTRMISADLRAAVDGPCISYHPSLLPRHRGMDSVRWTIEMDDPIAGGTVYELDDGWDTGPIVLQDWCHVAPAWDASDLWREQLFPMGVRLIRNVIERYQRTGELVTREQDERFATFEESFSSVERSRSTGNNAAGQSP